MKKMIFTLLLVLGFTQSAQAYTVYCTNCSDRWQQMIEKSQSLQQLQTLYQTYGETVTQTVQQIEMVRQNIEQYANMVKNTIAIPKNLINQIAGELGKFAEVTNALNTLRADIMGLEDIFDGIYEAQDAFKDLANMPRDMIEGRNVAIRKNIDGMSERVDEATKATFQLSGAQLKDIEMSGELESYMNELLSTPEGQQQALMAGNQLAVLQIQEARQLRELVLTTTQSDLASQVKAEKQEQLQEELGREFLDFKGMNEVPLIQELPL